MHQITETHSKAVTKSWGVENTSSKDLVIPKIKVAQANSNACKEGTARPGDLVHSLTNEVMAAKGHKLEVLPILCVPTWMVTGPKPMGGGFAEFIRKEPITPENDSDQWKIEEFENNKPVVWHKCLTYLVLLVNKPLGFPFFIDFQATNKNAGKLISTIMQENSFQDLPGPARVVDLSTSIKNYNNNSWFIISVAASRNSSEQELNTCKKWYDLFHKVEFKQAPEEDNGIS